MATQNRWQIGVMYYGGLLNGQPFYTQPAGPGTKVFPSQRDSVPWVDYPVVGLILNEFNPWWVPSCLHAIQFPALIQEWDYDTNQSVMLVCCSICSLVQRTIIPAAEAYNPVQNAIIVI